MPGKQKGGHRDKRLSAAGVRNESRPGRHMDGAGLFLQVDGTGAKRWGQRLMIKGKRRDIGLGSYPRVSLADARVAARENKEMARNGTDPVEARRLGVEHEEARQRAAAAVPTFRKIADQVCKKKAAELSNPKHAAQWRSTLETYAFPFIGDMRVSEITVQDIQRVLEPIWNEVPETASRLRGRIEAVLSSALVLGYRSGDNPARWRGHLSELLPSPARTVEATHLPSLDPRMAPFWWSALATREGMAARALEFLALTAARSGEVRGATWDEVDVARALWTIPGKRMKGGREHIVPLTPEALAVLDQLPRLDGSSLIFFAPRGGKLSDMSIAAVMKRMQAAEEMRLAEVDQKEGRTVPDHPRGFIDPKLKRPAVPHGLRSCFRTWAADEAWEFELSELALAHRVGNAVSRAYNRADQIERRRQMMQHWANFLFGKVGFLSRGGASLPRITPQKPKSSKPSGCF